MDGTILPDGAAWDTAPGDMHPFCRCQDMYITADELAALGIPLSLLLLGARRDESQAQPAASQPRVGGVSERELMGYGDLSEAEYEELIESQDW
jgi:hypothetical protein